LAIYLEPNRQAGIRGGIGKREIIGRRGSRGRRGKEAEEEGGNGKITKRERL